MKRPVTIHAVLLILALSAAYYVWTREPDTSTEDEVEILSIRGGLDKVVYASPERNVEVTRRRDDLGSYHWVKVETWEEPPPPPRPPAPKPPEPKDGDAKAAEPKQAAPRQAEPKQAEPKKPAPRKKPAPKQAPAKQEPAKQEPAKQAPTKQEPALKSIRPVKPVPPPKPKKVRKVQVFKGNKGLADMMKGLASLSAIRSLGVVDDDKLKLFGLTESKKTLTLVTGSAARVFIIGGNTFGSMDSYIQDRQDKRVYVVRPRLLQDFQYAEFRLMDRELHDFGDGEVDRVAFSVKAGGKKVLLHKNRRDPSSAHWVDETDPDKRKDFYRNWMGRFNRLRVVEFVQPDKPPQGLTELFTVEYFSGGKKLGFLRWFKAAAATPPALGPKPTPDAGVEDHYVETEHTRVKVKIAGTLGQEVARDLQNFLKQ